MKKSLFKGFQKAHKSLRGRGLRKIPGMSKASDALVQSLWTGENIIEVQGSRMYVDVNHPDPSMRKTFQNYGVIRSHEATTTRIFNKLLKPAETVVDLGANIGYFTLLSARLVGESGQVHSFEPEPRNFRYLTKNIELNDYSQVTANNMAISDEKGKLKLHVSTRDTGSHTLIPGGRQDEEGGKFIEVETTSLDEYLKGRNAGVNMIKMDVEGAEVLALKGMDKTLRDSDDLRMMIEFFPILITEMGYSPKDLVDGFLDDYGFRIYVVGDDYKGKKGAHVDVEDYETLMSMIKGERDHLNLFLEKGEGLFKTHFMK